MNWTYNFILITDCTKIGYEYILKIIFFLKIKINLKMKAIAHFVIAFTNIKRIPRQLWFTVHQVLNF